MGTPQAQPGPEAQVELILDPEERQRRKAERLYRLDVLQVPMLRLAGFLLLILAIYLHNRYLLDQDHPQIAAGYAAVTLTYSLASWALLYLLYRGPGCPLCDFLLGLDLVFFTGAIWISGGPQSWLFPALILRPADQLAGGFRRVVFFGLLSAACYAAMLALWGQPPGPRGFTILVLILAANFYLA
ncbi:MAG TPA: hypothetical protein VNO81_01775, partial [Candidatus Nitrosotenuis sp.]|nr:hypothetical protein [Candidatus Nitrosotenuis sp.]